MKIISYRDEKKLENDLKHELNESIDRAKNHNMWNGFPPILTEGEFEKISALVEEKATSLINCFNLSGLPENKKTSTVHILLRSIPAHPNHKKDHITGITISKKLMALLFVREKGIISDHKINRITYSTLPHELYHVVHKNMRDFKAPDTVGSCIVEEGLATIFQLQQMARKETPTRIWEEEKNKFKEAFDLMAKNENINKIQTFWQTIDDVIVNKNEQFQKKNFPVYPFCCALVASTLAKIKKSVTDTNILQMPASEILAPWCSGELSMKKPLPKMMSWKSFKRSFLTPQP